MGARHDTPGRRLLNFLMSRGGSASLWEIARRSADGRLLAQARPELDGLITDEKCGAPRSRRHCTRIFLTMKGWAACAALRPAWTPKRLSTDVLKAWLDELQRERDPWACQFIKDSDDAAELKRLRSMKWIRPPLKKKGPPAGIQPKGGFQRRIDPIQVGDKIIPSKIPSPAPITRPVTTTPIQAWRMLSDLRRPAQAPKEVCSFCAGFPKAEVQPHDCGLYMVPVDCATWLRTGPTIRTRAGVAPDTSAADNEQIKERIRKAGYADAIEGEKVRFDNRLISFAEWQRQNPE